MDSRIETYKHIRYVQKYLSRVIMDLMERSRLHDRSKLVSPEVEIFDEFTPKLESSSYNSDEYKGFLAEMKPALDHHYAANDHHPEYFEGGIREMNLIQLIEMLADWKAATLRHKDGDIYKSIEQNQGRFGYSDELKNILIKTAEHLDF